MSGSYEVNLFKPLPGYPTVNSRIILSLVAIWAIAVFGFHILLRVIEKPVPEDVYIGYSSAWPDYTAGNASPEQRQALAAAYLTVFGKYVEMRADPTLRAAMTQLVWESLPEDQRNGLNAAIETMTTSRTGGEEIAQVLGITNPLLIRVIPFSMATFETDAPTADLTSIPAVMDKYLIHYRSVLTDTSFLGFPFHYFYTAVFLLVLFVLMCLFYCVVIEKVNEKYGIEADE
ncbi:sodium/substrate symporter small subunit [Desulfovibrio inopinatus]|uniref:sodium/substrate symporter small subunit n=1 Tax=Desulfovibrio inopinatus TaxID=102109 RepID=UPI0004265C9D|nr:sodium/substrate symporter small subunit [Desulfovibrio inopinatus]